MKKIWICLLAVLICSCANAEINPEARQQFALQYGFSNSNPERCQLVIPVHNAESWRMGATNQPTNFYLDVTPPEGVLGDRYLDEDELRNFIRIPLGLQLQNGEDAFDIVVSEEGMLGVETYDPHRLYEAGPGCAALVDLAEKILGYRPGAHDFTGKTSVCATLEWMDGEIICSDASAQTTPGWDAGSICIRDKETLVRLDAMFAQADFSVGSVNCPSNLFLHMDYSDGSSADFAVAINSFDLFFCNGMYFTAGDGGELIDLFNLRESNFWKGYMEHEPYI